MNELAQVVLGGALVALGVLATAVADRIRGIRPTRGTTTPITTRPSAVAPPREVVRASRSAKPRHRSTIADEVIAALVASGHSKSMATDAVWNCGDAERETVERWTLSALRRCAREVTS